MVRALHLGFNLRQHLAFFDEVKKAVSPENDHAFCSRLER